MFGRSKEVKDDDSSILEHFPSDDKISSIDEVLNLSEPLLLESVDLASSDTGGITSVSVFFSVDEAVDMHGYGSFQILLLIAAGLNLMAASMETGILFLLSPILIEEWDLSSKQVATTTAVLFGSQMIGTLLSGRLADMFGRRLVFLASSILLCAGCIGTSCVDNFVMLLVFRSLVSIGVGGNNVPYDMCAEFLPSTHRGKYLLRLNYFRAAGSVLVMLLANWTLRGEEKRWKLFVLLCGVPSLLSTILCYLFVPDSPRWLLSQGLSREALDILKVVAVVNGKGEDLFESGAVIGDDHEREKPSFGLLLSPKWRKFVVSLWGVSIGTGFISYRLMLTYIEIFQKYPSSQSQSSFTLNFVPIALYGLSAFVGVILAVRTVDVFGRITSQVIFFSFAGLTVFSMLMRHSIKDALAITLAFVARGFEVAATSIMWLTTAEVLVTEIRTTGHSSSSAFVQVGALLAHYTVQGSISQHRPVLTMAVVYAFVILLVAVLPETEGLVLGRVMDEIEENRKETNEPQNNDEFSDIENDFVDGLMEGRQKTRTEEEIKENDKEISEESQSDGFSDIENDFVDDLRRQKPFTEVNNL